MWSEIDEPINNKKVGGFGGGGSVSAGQIVFVFLKISVFLTL